MQISNALALAGIEFTRQSEADPDQTDGDQNVFETIAMDHVVDTVKTLLSGSERLPEAFDTRLEDVIEVGDGRIEYSYITNGTTITAIEFSAYGVSAETGESIGLLANAIPQQVLLQNMEITDLAAEPEYAEFVDRIEYDNSTKQGTVFLKEGVSQYDLEGFAMTYRVWDWTANTEVTAKFVDLNKSHLSITALDVTEGVSNYIQDYDDPSLNDPDKVLFKILKESFDVDVNFMLLNSELTFDNNETIEVVFEQSYSDKILQLVQDNDVLGSNLQAELVAAQQRADQNGTTLEQEMELAEWSDDFVLPLFIVDYNASTQTIDGIQGVGIERMILNENGTASPVFSFELPANTNTLVLGIGILDDHLDGNTDAGETEIESFIASLSGERFYDDVAYFAVHDNDEPAELPVVSIDYVYAAEGDLAPAQYTVTMSKPSDEAVTVNYFSSNLSAIVGDDFGGEGNAQFTGSLTFAPGETSKTITVDIIDDLTVEEIEMAFMNIDLPDDMEGKVVIGDMQGSLRIFDNDGINVAGVESLEGDKVTFNVSLDAEIPEGATIHLYEVTNGATAIGSSSNSQVNDFLNETLEVYYFDENQQQQTIVLASDLSFVMPNGVSEFFVTYDSVDDNLQEDSETVRLHVNATYTDGDGNEVSRSGLGSSVIIDNDEANFSITGSSVEEGGILTFTVERHGSTNLTQTVDFDARGLAGDTANSDDFIGYAGTISFAPGETVKTFKVHTNEDAFVESDEYLTVELSNPSNKAGLDVNASKAQGIILNNDAIKVIPPTPVIPPSAAPAPSTGDGTAAKAEAAPIANVASRAEVKVAEPAFELVVQRNIPENKVEAGSEISVVIPQDTFGHSDPNANISLSAAMVDGNPIPNWLSFDATQGEFFGVPPKEFEGTLIIKIIARDENGDQVETLITIEVVKTDAPQKISLNGKGNFGEQLKSQSHFAWKAQRDQLIKAAKAMKA